MNKKIIIVIIVLLATVSVSGCIKTPMDNINNIIPVLSQNIETGDTNYNEAVTYLNSHNYDLAEEKVQTSSNNFLEAKNKMLEINKYNENINNTLYLQYLSLIEEELNLKENATSNLQLAIQNFKKGNKVVANNYVSTANKLMNQGISIQNQRNNLVKNNPDKFKEVNQ